MKRITLISIGFLSIVLLCSFGNRKYPPLLDSKGVAKIEAQDSPFFLIISDIHLNNCRNTTDANGDTDPGLWGMTKNELAKLLDKNPRFVLFTGDLPAHHDDIKNNCDSDRYPVDLYRRKDYDTVLHNIYTLFKGRNIPFLYVPGNNDVVTGDYGRFTQNGENVFSDLKAQYKYPTLNVGINKGQYPYIDSLNSTNCYYSVCMAGNLRVIVLNSIIFCKDEANTCSLEDGYKELDWMKAELQKAKNNHQNVYIAMHIPPGENFKLKKLWKKQMTDGFLQCTQDYRAVIKGIFYGHLHTDEFRFLYNQRGDSINSVAFSCPAITAYKHGNNPGFKMFRYDRTSDKITDVITYYKNINSPQGPWQSYSYSNILGCAGGIDFTNCLITKANTNLSKLAAKAHAIYFVKRNADKNPGDYPDAEEMQVEWKE